MKSLRLPLAPLKVSALCLGVADLGTRVDEDRSAAVVDAYLSAGGRFFDTAHVYAAWVESGSGVSERLLGKLLARAGALATAVIATKGGHPAFPPNYPRPDRYLSPEVLERDLAESLERLNRPWVDLYYLHRDDPRVPVGDLVDWFDEKIESGLIRASGVSNWSRERMRAALHDANRRGKRPFAASQSQWSLAVPNWQAEADPTVRYLTVEDVRWLAGYGIANLPYSATANGYFATAGTRGGLFDNEISRKRLVRAARLAEHRGVSANQVALAYLLSHVGTVVPVIGTTDPAHLADALGALDVRLEASELEWLEGGDGLDDATIPLPKAWSRKKTG